MSRAVQAYLLEGVPDTMALGISATACVVGGWRGRLCAGCEPPRAASCVPLPLPVLADGKSERAARRLLAGEHREPGAVVRTGDTMTAALIVGGSREFGDVFGQNGGGVGGRRRWWSCRSATARVNVSSQG